MEKDGDAFNVTASSIRNSSLNIFDWREEIAEIGRKKKFLHLQLLFFLIEESKSQESKMAQRGKCSRARKRLL